MELTISTIKEESFGNMKWVYRTPMWVAFCNEVNYYRFFIDEHESYQQELRLTALLKEYGAVYNKLENTLKFKSKAAMTRFILTWG